MTPPTDRASGAGVQGAPDPDVPPHDPWERYGWLMGAIWLVFLAFPLTAALTAERAVGWRVLTVLVIGVFAATYLRALWRDDHDEGGGGPGPWSYLGALVVLALATVPVIGLGALGLVPFVLSLGGMVLPLRQTGLLLAAAMVVGVTAPALAGELTDWFFLLLVYPMVTATVTLVRVLDRGARRQRETRRQLEITQERDRVARDVHDVLGHSLTVITVKTELAERLVDVDPERAKVEMAEVRSISRQALAEIRATVSGLRVARLTDEITSAQRALAGAGIELEVDGDPSQVDPRHRIVIAWALREAATNVVRHSGAGSCRVELRESSLLVRDDGCGPRGDLREGNGLRGLRERVEQAGGRVRVVPADPGTEIEVVL